MTPADRAHEPTIVLGTGPRESGGDGYPDGTAYYQALLDAKRARQISDAASDREQPITA